MLVPGRILGALFNPVCLSSYAPTQNLNGLVGYLVEGPDLLAKAKKLAPLAPYGRTPI